MYGCVHLTTEVTVAATEVEGKCTVVFGEDVPSTDDYFLQSPDRYYFNEVLLLSKTKHERDPEKKVEYMHSIVFFYFLFSYLGL